MRGATLECKTPISSINFNPRAPCGARPAAHRRDLSRDRFQPTRPLRGATPLWRIARIAMPFQPTRPLRGATDVGFCHVGLNRISTHAPLAGRDCRAPPRGSPASAYFNPRAPCGARLPFPSAWQRTLPFQPTRPLRGATCVELAVAEQMIFQPTRPLRGATTRTVHVDRDQDYFNPRAPCGARLLPCRASRTLQTFQPTRPLRGATTAEQQYCIAQGHFNPRAPCGARHCATSCVSARGEFQPTRPLRGATILGITSHSI